METDMPTALGETLARIQEEHGAFEPGESPEAEFRERQHQQRADAWKLRVPSRFRDAHVADFSDEVAGALCEWDTSRNLMIVGPVGVGKTHAAIGAAREPHFEAGLTLHFWPVVELLDALRPRADEETDIGELVKAPILLLDDLAAERATDWTQERLYALVNRRWLDERPTIVTTNVPPDQIEAAIGERLISRLSHDALVIRLRGEDRRR